MNQEKTAQSTDSASTTRTVADNLEVGDKTGTTEPPRHYTPPDGRVTIEDALGEFGFRVRWSVVDYWASVEVFEIVGRHCDAENTPLFTQRGAMCSSDTVENIDDAESYLEGFVKWDGCTELNMGCPHWCGAACYVKHIELLAYIWKRAFELMGREPWDEDMKVETSVFKVGS